MTPTLFDPPDGPDADHAGPADRPYEQTKRSSTPDDGKRSPAGAWCVDRHESESRAAAADHDAAAGELGKLDAMAQLAGRYPGRVLAAQRALVGLLLKLSDGATVTIDDVRARLGELDRNPRWLGCVVHGLSAAGLIARSGFVASGRRVAHARPVSAWRLNDRAAARAWLDTNARRADTSAGA